MITVKRFGFSIEVEPGDCMRLAVQGRAPWESDIYEEEITKLFRQNVKKGDVCLDLGAHIGYYTLLFSRLVGWKGQVYAFEPSIDNFAILERNVRRNRRKRNVTLERLAVADRSEEGLLLATDGPSGAYRVVYDMSQRISLDWDTIDTVSLDEYFTEEQDVDWIKMDIEGSEFYALQGAQRLLDRSNPIIIMEVFPLMAMRAGVKPKDAMRFLICKGFGLFFPDGRGVGSLDLLVEHPPGGHTGFWPGIVCVRDREVQWVSTPE